MFLTHYKVKPLLLQKCPGPTMQGQQILPKIGSYSGYQNVSQGLSFLFKLFLYSLVCILPLIFSILLLLAICHEYLVSRNLPCFSFTRIWQLKFTPSCVSKQISTILHLFPAVNCPDIWPKLWLQLARAVICSMQISSSQGVCFIHAVFLNASLKTRLVRTLCYHLLPTKDCDFLHYFQNRWQINFPEVSYFNGNVSILMQNFRRMILEWLKIKKGDCSLTLNLFSAFSFPFHCYIAGIFYVRNAVIRWFLFLWVHFSLSLWTFILAFVYSFRFWFFHPKLEWKQDSKCKNLSWGWITSFHKLRIWSQLNHHSSRSCITHQIPKNWLQFISISRQMHYLHLWLLELGLIPICCTEELFVRAHVPLGRRKAVIAHP